MNFWNQVLNSSAPLLSQALFGLVSAGITYLTAQAAKRIKHQTASRLLSDLSSIAGNVVREMNQTIVDDLKKKSADGKLSKEDAEQVRDAAVERVKQLVGPAMKKELIKYLGGENFFTNFIVNAIESRIKGYFA